MALKQGKPFITLAFIFLFALLLGLTVFLTVPPSSEAYADAPIVIKYELPQTQRSYGERFWGSDAKLLEDGRFTLRGTISNNVFYKSESGEFFLVYEPYGIREGGSMEKLTGIDGAITALPGTYTLSGASNYYSTHDYADIHEANGNELGVKVYESIEFTQYPTYVVQKRDVTINVDQSQGLLRYYGGPVIDLNYTITAGNMVDGDNLFVTFVSDGNLSDAGVGEYEINIEYDIELDRENLTVVNGELDKSDYYNITYSANRPKLVVEKYEIKVVGVGDIEDYYRYDGIHYAAFGAYEDISGINDETVRIFYMLDEAHIERIKGALPVSGEGEGYPTLVDYDRIEVYDASDNLVDHKANYEIDFSANNTRLVINKRPLTLFSGSGTPDGEDGLYIDSEVVSETYGYTFDEEFDRDIEIYGENITFRLAFSDYYAMPEAGEWALVLINSGNPWYDIALDESFTFVIEKYVLKLFDYTEGEGTTKYIAIDYGAGLLEYHDIIQVAETFEEIPFTLYSGVNETSIPGVHEFTSYLESRNFIIDYAGVKILIARKPISVTVQSPRVAGVEYGDEYSLVLEGLVDGFDAVLTTLYSSGSEFKAGTAAAGLPINAGTYKIRCTIDGAAMEFYTLGANEFADVSLNIAKRSIIVRYDLNYSVKEYGSAITLPALGTLSNVYESDPEQVGLINGDTLNGAIVCGGLIESAAAGTYIVNTSNLSNPNYHISGGVKVYYGGVLTTAITVNKLATAHLPSFAAVLSGSSATSVTLKNISIQGKEVGSFAISANGGVSYGAYQTANTFTGLASGKKYYFKVRIKGDSNIEQGQESAPLMVATALAVPTVKSTASTVDSLTLELTRLTSTAITYSYLFRLDNGAWKDSGEFADLLPGTKYRVSFKCVSADNIESTVGNTYIWTYCAPPEIIIEELVEIGSESISLSGLEDIYEFRIGIQAEGEDVEFSDWSSASSFSGLEQLTTYVIEIRVKASADNGNLSGESASFLLSTPERIIVEEPIHYEGIMEYVAKYFIVALMGLAFVLMLIFILGFTSKFKII